MLNLGNCLCNCKSELSLCLDFEKQSSLSYFNFVTIKHNLYMIWNQTLFNFETVCDTRIINLKSNNLTYGSMIITTGLVDYYDDIITW